MKKCKPFIYIFLFLIVTFLIANIFPSHAFFVKSDKTEISNGKYFVEDSVVKTTKTALLSGEGQDVIRAKGSPVFAVPATTDEGIFSIDDDLGVSYYYRGAVANNWVKFGKENGSDIWWRIVRINGDGSIRMVYTGIVAPTAAESVVMTGDKTGLYPNIAFNNALSGHTAELGGFQYILDNAHGYGKCTTSGAASCTVGGDTVYNSNAKKYLETWWDTTDLSAEYTSGNVADSIFCNDRRAFANAHYYRQTPVEAYGDHTSLYFNSHVNGKRPSLKCLNPDDRFSEDTVVGNGALLYPVGLLTVGEISFAGGVGDADNADFYLFTNTNYFTISPVAINNSQLYMGYFGVDKRIKGRAFSSNILRYRPVISLSADIIFSGTGTYDDPYVVATS